MIKSYPSGGMHMHKEVHDGNNLNKILESLFVHLKNNLRLHGSRGNTLSNDV